MLRVYKSPRYTIDLDASLKGINLDQIKSRVIEAIETSSQDGAWFRFEKNIDLETQGEYGGLRLVFRAGIGELLKNISKAQIVNLDLGVGDAVKEVICDLPLLLSDDECRCKIYPAEIMIAEKLHSLITRSIGNSRSKDVFDIAHLAEVISI